MRKEHDWDNPSHKDTVGRKSSHLWNDLKQSGLGIDFLRERGRKWQGYSPPPVLDWSVPCDGRASGWLCNLPSQSTTLCAPLRPLLHDYHHSLTVYALLCHVSLLVTCFYIPEKQKCHVKNLHRVTTGRNSVNWRLKSESSKHRCIIEVTLPLS